jgi:hypothetical protein
MKIDSGTKWPFIIAGGILGLIGLCVWTIIVTSEDPVEESHLYMTYYQKADAEANLIINNKIAFNKKYDIQYISKRLNPNDAKIVYKITTKNGQPVDDAKLKVIVTRPSTDRFNVTLEKPPVESKGIYTYTTKLSGPGRWNIMARVKVGRYERFYNIKTDTRNNDYITQEY